MTFLILCLLSLSVSAKEIIPDCSEAKKLCLNGNQIPLKNPDSLELKLDRVIDGETFIASGHKVKIWGINAPGKDNPAYRVSSWFLRSFLENETIICRFISLDGYQREVMKCSANSNDIGSMLVKFGMATDSRHLSSGYYEAEESEAKMKRRGIWGDIQTKN